MNWEQFESIAWPETFTVNCRDGTSLKLIKGDGVAYEAPADDPSGRGMICATMFPARSGARRSYGQCVFLEEIRSIEDENGRVIWGMR